MNRNEAIGATWDDLAHCREKHRGNKLLTWVRLNWDESFVGDLCGVRVYKRGLFGRREYAQVILGFQPPSYNVQVWRKRCKPVTVFVSDEVHTAPVAARLALESFEQVVDFLAAATLEDNLDTAFPLEWVGKSAWQVFRSPRT